MDQDTNDIVAGLNNCITRDGQGMPSAAINWNGQRLYNFATPSVAADAANKAYVDTANAVQAKNMAGYQINALGAPSSATDAATKGYVDSTVVSTSLPGLATNLGKVLVGTGGNVSWNLPGLSTVDATVTASTTLSGAYQYVPVAMSAALQAVTLPAATTLQLGGPHYWMRNTGVYPFELRDNTGVLLAVVPARGQILVTMTANGTAAGVWTVGNISEYAFLSNFINGPIYTNNNTGSITQPLQYVSPAANTYFVCWGATGVAATLSGTTVSFGSIYNPILSNPASMISYADISSTAILCMCGNSGSSVPQAAVMTLSGSTISVGTAVNLGTNTYSGSYSACCALSSSLGLAIWLGNSHVYAEAITMAGSTLTANTIYNIDSVMAPATASYAPSLTSLSATTALAVGLITSSSFGAVVLTVSGTTVSTGIPLTGIDTQCALNSVQPLGGGNYLVTYNTFGGPANPSGAVKMVVLNVNGTTVTAGAPVTVVTAGAYCGSILQSTQGYTGYCFYSINAPGYYAVPFTVIGTSITLNGAATMVSTSVGSSYDMAPFNVSGSGESLLFGVNASNNLTAQTVEFVK
ncbi:MAG: hypothetical protein JO002_00950 [Burkholderiaceae bacterium]|nr:hypothetical protein [Burkholderiaceae bacterium]